MSKKEKIQGHILNNPNLSNTEIAIVFDTTAETVADYRGQLRKEGKLPPLEEGWRQKNKPIQKPPAVKEEPTYEEDGLRLKIKEFFRKKDVRTLTELSDYFDMGVSKIRRIIETLILQGHNFKIEGEEVHFFDIQEAVYKRKESAYVKAENRKIKELIDALDQSNTALENALAIKNPVDYKSHKIEWDEKLKSEAVALVQFSDWHVGKRIDKRTTNGLNEYSPDIAKKRSETVTANLLKLIKKERKDVNIENLVINLGGDAIQNFLHEGDAQQNYFSPLEEVRFAKQLIGNSLKTIAENGDFKKIVLLCQRGNHPRLTKRMQSNVDYKMNLEAMLYWSMADDFSDPVFEWHIPESDIGYYKIGDRTIRYFHGHQVGYQGGVGGLTIPMNKKVMYYDKTIKADYDMVSHWHQFQIIGQRVSVNSCLCGWDEYAQSNGFAYEPPTQTLQLMDKKRGLTGRFPIFCE